MSDEAVDPNLRYQVKIKWLDFDTELLVDVLGWHLDNDVYFLFIENPNIPEKHAFRTIWTKHPDLKSITLTPYIKEI